MTTSNRGRAMRTLLPPPDTVWAGSGERHGLYDGRGRRSPLRRGRAMMFSSVASTPILFYGGNGNDYIDGGKGKDNAYGGAGNDTVGQLTAFVAAVRAGSSPLRRAGIAGPRVDQSGHRQSRDRPRRAAVRPLDPHPAADRCRPASSRTRRRLCSRSGACRSAPSSSPSAATSRPAS